MPIHATRRGSESVLIHLAFDASSMAARKSRECASELLSRQGHGRHTGGLVGTPPKRAFFTALFVASLHAVLLLAIGSVLQDRPSSHDRVPALSARLIVPAGRAPSDERRGNEMKARASNRRDGGGARAPSRTTNRQAVPSAHQAAISAAEEQSDAPAASAPTGGDASHGAGSAPLDLSLRPGAADAVRSHNPALQQVNPSHRSTEARIASALVGDGATSIEELGDGRVRVRRGSTCYEMARSKMSELDPFAPKPGRQMEICRN